MLFDEPTFWAQPSICPKVIIIHAMNMLKTIKRLLSRGLRTLCLLALPLGAIAAGYPEALLTKANPRVQEVIAVQEALTPELMAVQDVLGTAVGQDADGQIVMLVYVNREAPGVSAIVRALPPQLRGVRIRAELTEPFVALKKGGTPGPPDKPGDDPTDPPADTTDDPKAAQTRPIFLGTSGGWGSDIANGYCCGGTLGCLIQASGVQYILSNYHVFEADNVDGGNGIVATTGDAIIQPALIDVGCDVSAPQAVASLVEKSSLPGSNVDAAIARVVPGMVREDGAILGIGTTSSQTVEAFIRQGVKKSGRTTGVTRSKVSGLNATVSVSYEDECAGALAFTQTFTGQIIISNRGSRFLAGGDSGSLMVENSDSNPRAVGLLFAGSSTLAVANPIDEVLEFFGATMVGN
jgi:hypothetical protein